MESGIQYSESGIHRVESTIQDCHGFPYMGRNLGIVYRNLGQYSKAKENYEKALIIKKEIYGEKHGDVAASYNDLGIVYSDLGQYSEGKEYFEKAFIIRKEIYGDQHALTERTFRNLKRVDREIRARIANCIII